MIDCNKDFDRGNFGCDGGNMLIAYDYVKNNSGISRSAVYPYRGADTYPCNYKPINSVTSLSSYQLLPSGDEKTVLLALVAIGPLSAAMDSSLPSFQNYRNGIYSDPLCTRVINHAILYETN